MADYVCDHRLNGLACGHHYFDDGWDCFDHMRCDRRLLIDTACDNNIVPHSPGKGVSQLLRHTATRLLEVDVWQVGPQYEESQAVVLRARHEAALRNVAPSVDMREAIACQCLLLQGI